MGDFLQASSFCAAKQVGEGPRKSWWPRGTWSVPVVTTADHMAHGRWVIHPLLMRCSCSLMREAQGGDLSSRSPWICIWSIHGGTQASLFHLKWSGKNWTWHRVVWRSAFSVKPHRAIGDMNWQVEGQQHLCQWFLGTDPLIVHRCRGDWPKLFENIGRMEMFQGNSTTGVLSFIL